VGSDSTGFLSQVTFSWVWPLLQRGKQGSIAEDTASAFVREDTRAPRLAAELDAVFDRLRVRAAIVTPPLPAEAWCPEMASCPLCIPLLLGACMHDAVWRAHACMTLYGAPVSSLLRMAGRCMEWCRSLRTANVWHPTCPTPLQDGDPGNVSNLLLRAMLHLYWPRLSLQSFWTLGEVGMRCALPLPLHAAPAVPFRAPRHAHHSGDTQAALTDFASGKFNVPPSWRGCSA
jgi:hypothetical protein